MAWGQDAKSGALGHTLESTSCPAPRPSITRKSPLPSPNEDFHQKVTVCVSVRGLDRS